MRIEIDNVLAYAGAERFWQGIVIKQFGETTDVQYVYQNLLLHPNSKLR